MPITNAECYIDAEDLENVADFVQPQRRLAMLDLVDEPRRATGKVTQFDLPQTQAASAAANEFSKVPLECVGSQLRNDSADLRNLAENLAVVNTNQCDRSDQPEHSGLEWPIVARSA